MCFKDLISWLGHTLNLPNRLVGTSYASVQIPCPPVGAMSQLWDFLFVDGFPNMISSIILLEVFDTIHNLLVSTMVSP